MEKLLSLQNPIQCFIVKRINRFVVEVKIDNKNYMAYITNTGRLNEFMKEGKEGYCIVGRKKTKYRLFAIKDEDFAALIDTQLQMKAFEKAIKIKAIPWLKDYEIIKKNVRIYDSILDYLLYNLENKEKIFLEIKSAVLRGNKNFAMYPDCPTERGRKHIQDLIRLANMGERTAIIFIAALPNANAFKPFKEGDPEIAELLLKAFKANVLIKAIAMYYNPLEKSVYLYNPELPVILS
ncbi:MAG: DNA/RNA nuclease SfsA [Nitrososphaerota archaeon]